MPLRDSRDYKDPEDGQRSVDRRKSRRRRNRSARLDGIISRRTETRGGRHPASGHVYPARYANGGCDIEEEPTWRENSRRKLGATRQRRHAPRYNDPELFKWNSQNRASCLRHGSDPN